MSKKVNYMSLAGQTQDIWGQSKNTANPVDCVAVLLSIFTLTPNIPRIVDIPLGQHTLGHDKADDRIQAVTCLEGAIVGTARQTGPAGL